MSWAKLLADNRVTALPSSKAELDNLRSIVARSLKDVTSRAFPPITASSLPTMPPGRYRCWWCGRPVIGREPSAAITTPSWHWRRPTLPSQNYLLISMVAG